MIILKKIELIINRPIEQTDRILISLTNPPRVIQPQLKRRLEKLDQVWSNWFLKKLEDQRENSNLLSWSL